MKTVYARKGCAGYIPGGSGEGEDSRNYMCGRCGMNRTIHRRRLRIIDGGKHEEGAPMVTSAISEIASTEHVRAAATVAAALHLAGPGAIVYLTVPDAANWEALKGLLGDVPVRLMGNRQQISEWIDGARVGDITVSASGPTWAPSLEEYNRMLDQRGER